MSDKFDDRTAATSGKVLMLEWWYSSGIKLCIDFIASDVGINSYFGGIEYGRKESNSNGSYRHND